MTSWNWLAEALVQTGTKRTWDLNHAAPAKWVQALNLNTWATIWIACSFYIFWPNAPTRMFYSMSNTLSLSLFLSLFQTWKNLKNSPLSTDISHKPEKRRGSVEKRGGCATNQVEVHNIQVEVYKSNKLDFPQFTTNLRNTANLDLLAHWLKISTTLINTKNLSVAGDIKSKI